MSAVECGNKYHRTVKEAICKTDKDKWEEGIKKEFKSMYKREVWTVIPKEDLPEGSNIMDCK